MNQLESQITKIQLGNFKKTSHYVCTLAEKAEGSVAELYFISEIPLTEACGEQECKKISLAISTSLKRVFRKPINGGSFESAISEINEELGKIAAKGQTKWINNINSIVAVKYEKNLHIATAGKVSTYLFRNSEFTDISCSPESPHPLKTFENYATGKIKLGDVLILSTTQLFNYLSMDRLKDLLTTTDFFTASQAIIETLRENAGSSVAFGTLLNLQVPLGEVSSEKIDLKNYTVEMDGKGFGFLEKLKKFFKTAFALDKKREVPRAINTTKKTFVQKLKQISNTTKIAAKKSLYAFSYIKRGMTTGKDKLDLKNFHNFSNQKKFFFISAGILLVAFIINIFIASYYRGIRTNETKITNNLEKAKNLIADAESSLLYKDETAAKNFLLEATSNIPDKDKIKKSNSKIFLEISKDLENLKQKLEKNTKVNVTTISDIGNSKNLLSMPGILAVQVNGQILSYNLQDGRLNDGNFKIPENVTADVSINNDNSVIYDQGKLRIWKRKEGKLGPSYTQNVPNKEAFGGIAYYQPNSRVYVINKEKGQIISFAVIGDSLARPVASVTSNTSDLKTAVDIAIDGNIYVLSKQGITKYRNGTPAEFDEPTLITPLSGEGKIYASPNSNFIYILDKNNNRIVILDSKGKVQKTLHSSEFTNLIDFVVDEPNKIIYVLNGSTLLKVNIP